MCFPTFLSNVFWKGLPVILMHLQTSEPLEREVVHQPAMDLCLESAGEDFLSQHGGNQGLMATVPAESIWRIAYILISFFRTCGTTVDNWCRFDAPYCLLQRENSDWVSDQGSPNGNGMSDSESPGWILYHLNHHHQGTCKDNHYSEVPFVSVDQASPWSLPISWKYRSSGLPKKIRNQRQGPQHRSYGERWN